MFHSTASFWGPWSDFSGSGEGFWVPEGLSDSNGWVWGSGIGTLPDGRGSEGGVAASSRGRPRRIRRGRKYAGGHRGGGRGGILARTAPADTAEQEIRAAAQGGGGFRLEPKLGDAVHFQADRQLAAQKPARVIQGGHDLRGANWRSAWKC